MTTGSPTSSPPPHRRIALVCDWCLPRFGGLELQLMDLARALRAAGHQVEIVTATPGPDQIDDIPIRRLGGLRMPWFGFTCSPRQFREYRRLIESGGYDVVHVHSGIIAPLAYGGAAIASRAGVPTAVTFHSVYDYLEPALHTLARISDARRLRIAWSAVGSRVARETSRALGGTLVALLPNGIDPYRWVSPPATPVPGVFRLIAVMRLQVRKRPRDLFKMLRDAQRQLGTDMRVTLDIVGDGPERRAVDRLAAAAGADRVRVHGRRTREEILTLFAQCDTFVLPTRMEAFGIAALEARCAGLPVIAFRNTGVEDFIVDHENGLLVDSPEELATAAAKLALDETLRSEIARRNRGCPPPYSWGHIVTATLAQYDRAAALQLA